MPAFLASPLIKIGLVAAALAVAGIWIALLQRDLAAAVAERNEARAQIQVVAMANKALSDGLDRVTADKAAFAARAAAAEKAAAETQATVVTRTETVIRTIKENAVAQDREIVSPALRAAVRSLPAE